MEQSRIKYRKLPGRRRGFLFGSSVWMGPDHLLLVKSARFREDYKRFYFRDIQAIVTAEAPRFHISTRAAAIGVILLPSLIAAYAAPQAPAVGEWVLSLLGLVLVAAWLYVSAALSCRCRIYTAVSSDELTSVYRRWTARKFLERVQPFIAQAQGVLEGNWAEAVEDKQIGPIPEGRIGLATPGPRGTLATPLALPHQSAALENTALSNLFVGTLCLGGIVDIVTTRLSGPVARWILLFTLLLQLAAAVAVLVQSSMGKLRPAMRNLAIVALLAMGVWYYAVQIGASIAFSIQNEKRPHTRVVPAQAQAWSLFEQPLTRETAGGMTLLLGLAGIILSLRGERPPQEKVSFNV